MPRNLLHNEKGSSMMNTISFHVNKSTIPSGAVAVPLAVRRLRVTVVNSVPDTSLIHISTLSPSSTMTPG